MGSVYEPSGFFFHPTCANFALVYLTLFLFYAIFTNKEQINNRESKQQKRSLKDKMEYDLLNREK